MKKLKTPTQRARAYVYRVLLAAVPLATAYGLVNDAQAMLWLALGGALLGVGLAAKNTPTDGAPRHVKPEE